MSRKTTIGHGKSRRTRNIRVAPITHAVRLALAASATVFALAGSGAALAQTCTDEANNIVYCDGAFAEPVAYENVDDLTVVLGANSPTSVTVTGESVGVLVSGTGTLGITSDADVTLYSSDTALGLAVLATDRYAMVEARNSGDVVVEAPLGTVAGMYARGGVADIGNSGTLTATAGDGRAFGIRVRSRDATVNNSGSIASTSQSGIADGMYVFGQTAEVTNSGTITASGAARAAGIAVWGRFAPTVVNCGDITATSEGGSAHGIAVRWGDGGKATARNCGGDITVTATGVDVGDDAIGLDGRSLDSGHVSLRNHGSIDVSAVGGDATGIFGEVHSGAVSLVNGGAIDAFSAEGNATGMSAVQHATGPADGGIMVRNTATGTIAVTSDLDAAGIQAAGDIVVVDNAGLIEAAGLYVVSGTVSYSSAIGIIAMGQALASVNNTGRVEASDGPRTIAIDADATGPEAIARVSNAGDLIATASSIDGQLAAGIAATSADAVEVTNTGSITAGSEAGFAIGIHAEGAETMVSNTATGTIDVTAYFDATGIQAAGDIVVVDNAGLIDAVGSLAIYGPSTSTLGVIATGQALASVDNTGRVEASDSIRTIAIYADANSTGPEAIARVSNAGDVIATSSSTYGVAAGIAAFSADGVEVTNTGSIQSIGALSFGIYAEGDDLDIVNAGTIAAIGSNSEYHYGSVIGILARAPVGVAGTVEITTLEGSSITAESLPNAVGILAGGGDAIRIDNAGDISVVDDFDPDSIDFGFGGSYGIRAGSSVQLDIDNSGEITVDVTVGGATGISAGGWSIDIVNDGAIDVYSDGVRRSINATDVYGVRAFSGQDATVVNNGDIDAGNGFGTASGIYARTAGDAAVRNDGTIAVTGGDVLYYGENFGIHVRSPDAGIQIDNAGQIAVTAPGTGNYGGTGAIGIFADGGEVVVTNTGSITADSLYSSGTSVGVATQGDVLTVVNHGDIHASTATADQYAAIGVQMDATTSATFNNTGTITTTTANGVGSGVAVLIESDGAINFSNTGTLLGAVITRGGDDAVTGQAGSKWTLTRQTTDLGAGDDRIRNLFGSTLDLDSGRIVLGEGRNSFANHGLIRVRGDSLIDMGNHAGTRDSNAGWNSFVNNGVIDLAGASNDDRLTLAGDLAGRGSILVGLAGHGTRRGGLMVEGSVHPGSVQTVNVQFTGFDAIRQGARTDFAFVQRDSTAGSFVGGEVLGFEAGNFLELGVDVDSQIDAGNQRADVFSASVQAEGLDDSGRLAASLGAGAQSLLAAQIGTWRQRSGVLPGHSPDRTMTGFVRSFGNQGEISPMYTGNAGQRSDFGFGQHNAGAEMGMHYQPAAGFSMGMRVGKSEGQQTLTGVGRGLNWIQADTFGVYGTWLSPKGLYVDTSAWRMDFDSRMQSPGSRRDLRGDASAVNVETGYAFRLPSGLRVEPSLQYTWTRIDGLSLQGSQAEFRSEAGDWRRARVGVLAWKPIYGGSGITWTPYGSISAVHTDASGASYTVSDVFNGGTSMDGASTLLELGLGLRRRGFSANAGLNWTSGDTVGNALGGQVLLRYGW